MWRKGLKHTLFLGLSFAAFSSLISMIELTTRVLVDFGIARLLSPAGDAAVIRAFSPQYAAPEQRTGGAITTATDVYALGTLLYEIIVGAPPFFGGGAAEIMIQHAETDPVPPSKAAPEPPRPAPATRISLLSSTTVLCAISSTPLFSS